MKDRQKTAWSSEVYEGHFSMDQASVWDILTKELSRRLPVLPMSTYAELSFETKLEIKGPA